MDLTLRSQSYNTTYTENTDRKSDIEYLFLIFGIDVIRHLAEHLDLRVTYWYYHHEQKH